MMDSLDTPNECFPGRARMPMGPALHTRPAYPVGVGILLDPGLAPPPPPPLSGAGEPRLRPGGFEGLRDCTWRPDGGGDTFMSRGLVVWGVAPPPPPHVGARWGWGS